NSSGHVRLMSGLYAIFPRGIAYLGSARPLRDAEVAIRQAMFRLGRRHIGRGQEFARVQTAVNKLRPSEYRLAADGEVREANAHRARESRAIAGLLTELRHATGRFAKSIGSPLGPCGSCCLIGVDLNNARVTTVVGDATRRYTRQVSSASKLVRRTLRRASF